MNYLCNCDPCTCAAEGVDRMPSSAHSHGAACQQAGTAPEPPIGAHLISPRRGYTHHGIYDGGGIVLHYAGLARNFQRGPVEAVSMERFANGRPVHIECRSTSALAVEEIVSRARSRLGEDRYRLLTNNCEHFVEWSRFGTIRSRQVERWFGPAPMMTRALVSKIGSVLARFRPANPMHAFA